MEEKERIKKIMQKKEFSQLPVKDVEFAFEKFNKPENNEHQKFKLTRQFLRKIYSSFSSRKLLSTKDKEAEYILKKHKSTKERFDHYKEVYKRIFKGIQFKSVIDLGAGVNGISHKFMPKKINYFAVEAVGQLVELMNSYFEKEKINGKAFHFSLFELGKVKDLLKKQKKPHIVFLFKVVDSLETMKRNYSKEFILGISKFSERIVVSFATRSLGTRKKFSVNRGWIVKFINENFKVLDDFELGGERYLVFEHS